MAYFAASGAREARTALGAVPVCNLCTGWPVQRLVVQIWRSVGAGSPFAAAVGRERLLGKRWTGETERTGRTAAAERAITSRKVARWPV
eukprot:5417591-Pleurochrysis_carterae.AAC.2